MTEEQLRIHVKRLRRMLQRCAQSCLFPDDYPGNEQDTLRHEVEVALEISKDAVNE